MSSFAPAGKRFIAFLIDWYLSSLLGSIPVIIMQSIRAHDLLLLNSLVGLPPLSAWIAGLLALFCHFLYYCYLPSQKSRYRLRGQTIGMRLMHLQLLTEQETEVALTALTARHMLLVIVLQGYLTSSHIYLMNLFEISTGFDIIPYAQVFYYVTILLSLLHYFFAKRGQLLQDRLTKTRMYRTDLKISRSGI